MSEEWYVVEGYKKEIKKVQVLRHTDQSVWKMCNWRGKVERVARTSSYSKYFPSLEEAIAFVENAKTLDVERCKEGLADAERWLAKFLADKEAGTLVKD